MTEQHMPSGRNVFIELLAEPDVGAFKRHTTKVGAVKT